MASCILQSRLDGPAPLRSDDSARVLSTDQAVDAAQENDLFQQHSKHVEEHASRKAAWRKEWEVVWYNSGSLRLGKVVTMGGSFFCHIKCGGEHSCKNMPRVNSIHQCKRVGAVKALYGCFGFRGRSLR